jgi:hypothetical protein
VLFAFASISPKKLRRESMASFPLGTSTATRRIQNKFSETKLYLNLWWLVLWLMWWLWVCSHCCRGCPCRNRSQRSFEKRWSSHIAPMSHSAPRIWHWLFSGLFLNVIQTCLLKTFPVSWLTETMQ